MTPATFYLAGAQISWLRIAIASAAELLLIAYLVWAAGILRR